MKSIITLAARISAAATLGVAFATLARADASVGGSYSFYNGNSNPQTIAQAASVDLTIGSTGAITITQTGVGPYDGIEDTLVLVTNDSSSVVDSLNLSNSSPTFLDIFGFDGDGISTYTGLSSDSSGYGSPDSYFTNITGPVGSGGALETGTVNFSNGISANGGQDYFSLEEDLASAGSTGGISVTTGGGGGVPDSGSTALLIGAGLLAIALASRKLRTSV